MHGVPRAKPGAPVDEAKARAKQEKVAALQQLTGEVIRRHRANIFDEASAALSRKLLQVSPETATAWNFRKRMLLHQMSQLEKGTLSEGQRPSAAAALLEEELQVAEAALRRNPKAYGAWHHRKFVVTRAAGDGARALLRRELHLCEQLLLADDRNFHCWGHRRLVARLLQVPVQQELEFTTAKLNQNFSNYSAWHYRSALLELLHMSPVASRPASASTAGAIVSSTPSGGGVPQWLEAEFDLVKSAYYTEPEDQSAWLYHRWLVGQALKLHRQQQYQDQQEQLHSAGEGWMLALLDREIASCEELLQLEASCKWAMVTLTRLRQQRCKLVQADRETAHVDELFKQLSTVDSMRHGYYKHAQVSADTDHGPVAFSSAASTGRPVRSTQATDLQREDLRARIANSLQTMSFVQHRQPLPGSQEQPSLQTRGLSDAVARSWATDIEARAMERATVCSGDMRTYCALASELLLQYLQAARSQQGTL